MQLTMKSRCERCRSSLQAQSEAYICSFECTFCPACAVEINYACPNCQGELIRRPRRPAVAPPEGDDCQPRAHSQEKNDHEEQRHAANLNEQPIQHVFILPGRVRVQPVNDRLVVKTAGRVVFLDVDEIDWIEAAANYIRVHSGRECYLVRQTISAIFERLTPGLFVRIHRSIIANICKIKELQPCNSGEYIVLLKDGKELPCSRSYRGGLRQLLLGDL